jgi:ElaB/YqjD/DUF883 family membrane-anchored ribosome-binding protein
MDERTREGSPELAQPQTGEQKTPEPEEIRREIAETREELGDTVEALTKKADVKSQAKAKVAERKEALVEKQEQAKAKVAEVRDKVSGATPEQAKQTAAQVAGRARRRPVPVTAVAALVAGVLIGWLLARR